jgi:hypothetical protein
MATIPPPDTIPESPAQPAQTPDEIVPPTPDVDVPDPNPADPGMPEDTPSPRGEGDSGLQA